MNIKDIKEKKATLESQIYVLLKNFELESECSVDDVFIEKLDTLGSYSQKMIGIKLEVKI